MTNKPNFFIVGVAKSGTTALANDLAQHPEILMSKIKEPNYFAKADNNLKRVVYSNDLDSYLSLFDSDRHYCVVGEASPSYLFTEGVEQKIKAFSPSAKIIVIIRNPIESIISRYQHQKWMGDEKSNRLEKSLQSELSNPNYKSFNHAPYRYLERALVSHDIRRYKDVFDTKNIHYIKFDNYVNDRQETLQNVFAFLNVNDHFLPDRIVQNSHRVLRSEGIHKFLMWCKLSPSDFRGGRTIKYLSMILPVSLFNALISTAKRFYTKEGQKQIISDEMRKALEKHFEDEVRELEVLTGIKLRDWYRSSL